jgi:hypothetical protein
MTRLLVLGCGYSARRFLDLHGSGLASVSATARSPETIAALAARGLEALSFDGTEISSALRDALARATHLLVSVPTGPGGDPALPPLAGILTPDLSWLGYLSTVGVYGDAGGGWVDETTPVSASEPRARRRIEAERGWAAFADSRGASSQAFRIAGIYGPGRNALRQIRDGSARRIVKVGQVFNRIHVDDIAAAIAAGITHPELTGPINLADDEPAPSGDPIAYAAKLLGVAPPPEISFEAAELSEMARSFWSSNKRVSNRRLREKLGVELAFPTYREGLAALLAAGE